ncbi:efflux RND transporter periplasmic adaptor subunit [Terricaulis sp.]|uniref:efflux RND transporter periplasmic adaptor subunit n=1 Tax=Terricaulis sp. TaxID=2768686 RepID=UPI0037850B0D
MGGLRFATLASLLAATVLVACGRPVEEAPPAPAVAPAGLIHVVQTTAPDYKTVAAVLTNRDVGDARARISGTVQRLLVREGDQVRRGQLLAIVADQRLSLEAQAGSAGVAAAEATAERARADLQRAQFLFERGVFAQARLDAVQAEARAAEAQLRAARAQAGAAGAVAAQGRVYAPADGRVTRLPIPQGAVVMPGDVVVAISTGARVLRIELPEGEASMLREGQEIRILTEGDPGVRTARVRQVYPAIDEGLVTADLDASSFEGEFIGARVRVLAPAGERQAFVIPATYIVTRYGVDYVRLWRNGSVVEAPVQRGAPTPMEGLENGVEILSGLREGDQIVPAETGA